MDVLRWEGRHAVLREYRTPKIEWFRPERQALAVRFLPSLFLVAWSSERKKHKPAAIQRRK